LEGQKVISTLYLRLQFKYSALIFERWDLAFPQFPEQQNLLEMLALLFLLCVPALAAIPDQIGALAIGAVSLSSNT